MQYVPENNNTHTSRKGSSISRKLTGQTTIIIALSMVALIAFVGLAVDGGSMYAQRRNAQNSADAAALAATEQMLSEYQTMVQQYPDDHDGTPDQESRVSDKLTQFANAHGIPRSNLHAYYVNDGKQIVTNTEVGQYGGIPWTMGAKGIVVKNTSEVSSYFMNIFGWNTVGAAASASAFMGVAVDADPTIGLFPVGFYTDTDHLNSLVAGQTYTLINGNSLDSGNWGYIDFNGNGNSTSVVQAWMSCGFNPSVTAAQWPQWCTSDSGRTSASGPTQYETGWPQPTTGAQFATTLHWGEGANGWWIAASPGTQAANCHYLSDLANGQQIVVPMFDASNNAGGNGTWYHLISVAFFVINTVDVDCNGGNNVPAHWRINGVFQQIYRAGSSGRHGDTRHVSQQTVFLDN